MIDAVKLWAELSSVSPGEAGIVRRRVLPETSRDIYLGVAQPGQHQMLILRVAAAAAPDEALLPSTRAIRSTVIHVDDQHSEIRVALISPEMLRVFATFTEDVAAYAARESTDQAAVSALIARFAHWRRMLAGEARGGLSRDEAQGLWAEMWVLRNVLHGRWAHGAVDSWTGYDRDDKDFRRGPLAVEVKSTRADAPHAVKINGEHQLDLGNSDVTLLLAVLEVDAHEHGAGENLNDAVAATRAAVGPADAEQLDQKLATFGYLDGEADLYTKMRYTLRGVRWHRVDQQFPRITPATLPDGVGRVTYLLSVDACTPWRVDDTQLDAVLNEGTSV